MGEAADMYGLQLFVLRILPENMVCPPTRKTLVCTDIKLWFQRHGPHTNCPLTFSEEFVLKYMRLGEGTGERTMLQRRYGKANLEKLARQVEEDRANREWLDKSTMACPGCGVHTEKSMGCNHVRHFFRLPCDRLVIHEPQMTCGKCSQHFCYLCGGKLAGSDPYQHFSRKGHPCYQRLFDFESIQDDWQPVEGFDLQL